VSIREVLRRIGKYFKNAGHLWTVENGYRQNRANTEFNADGTIDPGVIVCVVASNDCGGTHAGRGKSGFRI
jgi:hypothetical protein